MSTLIVGGDRVNTYKDFLLAQGFGPVLHWNGRKKKRVPPYDTGQHATGGDHGRSGQSSFGDQDAPRRRRA